MNLCKQTFINITYKNSYFELIFEMSIVEIQYIYTFRFHRTLQNVKEINRTLKNLINSIVNQFRIVFPQ